MENNEEKQKVDVNFPQTRFIHDMFCYVILANLMFLLIVNVVKQLPLKSQIKYDLTKVLLTSSSIDKHLPSKIDIYNC